MCGISATTDWVSLQYIMQQVPEFLSWLSFLTTVTPWLRKYGNPSVRESLVLITVRPYDRTNVHPSMYGNATSITWPYCGLKFKAHRGGHTPANLQRTFLILDIHDMVNWHLSKQGLRWPISRDHIAGSNLELIEVSFFFGSWPLTR